MNIKLTRRMALSLGLALALGACMSAPAEEPGASLVTRGYSVSSVDLRVADNAFAEEGMFRQDPALVEQLKQDLNARLTQMASQIRGGEKRATVRVELTQIRVANDTSRTILGADTHVVGNVVVTDSAGNVLAQNADVRFVDTGKKNNSTFNGIPIGFLISTAANAAGASDEQRIARLSEGFTAEVAAWLTR